MHPIRLYRYAILTILLIIPLLYFDGMMWGFHTPRYLFLQLSIILLLNLHLWRPDTRLRISPLDVAILAFVLYISICSLFSQPGYSLYNRVDILVYFTVFYFLLQLIPSRINEKPGSKFITHSFQVLALSAFLLAVYGLLQFFNLDVPRIMTGSGPYLAAESRVIATMGDANSLAGYLVAVFPFYILSTIHSKGTLNRILLIAGAGVIVSALVLTLSRGAWLALLVGGMIALFPVIRAIWIRFLPKAIYKVMGSVGVLGCGLLVMWSAYSVNPDSAKGRLFIWDISLNMIADRPFFGAGYGRYGVEYLNYQAQYFDDPSHSMHFDQAYNAKGAKNEFLQILAETGIVGIAFYLILLILFYHMAFRLMKAEESKKEEKRIILAFIASFTIIIIHSLVDNPLYVPAVALVFWFNLGMISNKAKEFDILPLFKNRTINRFIKLSFKHGWLLRTIGLILLGYTVFQVYTKAEGFIHWRNGQDLVPQNEWYRGIEEYGRAHQILSKDGELKFHLGAAYAYTRQPEKALPLLRAAKLNFNDKNLYIVEGSTLFQLGRYEEAEESFQTALRMWPKLLLPRLWLAEMYWRIGREAEAFEKLQEILSIQPKVMTSEIKSIKQDALRLLEIYGFNGISP